jgi:uncharacterized protein YjbI with pentapeptide repeats
MMVTPKSIGIKLSVARKRKNYSQATFAQEIAVSPQAVGKWERGESLPDIIFLSRIAELLSVDLNYFSEQGSSNIENEEKALPQNKDSSVSDSIDKKKNHNWNMSESNWINVDFSGIKNIQGRFHSSNVKKCKFIGADLSSVQMKSNNLDLCDFNHAKLTNMLIQKSNFVKCSLKSANLKETEFLSSYLSSCELTKSDLTKVLFAYVGFDKLNFDQVGLNRTAFVNTRFSNVQFSGTMDRCSFEKCSFSKVTFHKVKFIQTFFKYNDLKRVKFMDCQADRLTYELLKHGKADLTGISVV